MPIADHKACSSIRSAKIWSEIWALLQMFGGPKYPDYGHLISGKQEIIVSQLQTTIIPLHRLHWIWWSVMHSVWKNNLSKIYFSDWFGSAERSLDLWPAPHYTGSTSLTGSGSCCAFKYISVSSMAPGFWSSSVDLSQTSTVTGICDLLAVAS